MIPSAQTLPNEVTVLFRDAALVFALPDGATFEDLAKHLAGIEEKRFGQPLSIDVTIRH